MARIEAFKSKITINNPYLDRRSGQRDNRRWDPDQPSLRLNQTERQQDRIEQYRCRQQVKRFS